MLHVTIYKVTESCNYIVLSIIISDLQFTTSKRAIFISYILIMDIILMKDSMVISRGVSDVGFSIFADTDADADFAF